MSGQVCYFCTHVRTKLSGCFKSTEWSWRRLTLFTIVPGACVLVALYPSTAEQWFFLPILVVVSASLVLNATTIAPSLHKRPIYLGDLEDLEANTAPCTTVDEEAADIRANFHKYFFILVNVSFVLMLAAFADYAYFICRDSTHDTSYIEVAGLVGGVIGLWSRAQQMAGRLLLVACFHLRKRRLDQRPPVQEVTLQSILLPFQLERHRQLDRVCGHQSARASVESFLGV